MKVLGSHGSQFKIIQKQTFPTFEPFPSGNPILPPFHYRNPDTHQTQNLSQILHLVTSLLPFKAHQPSMNSKPSPSMSNGWGFRFFPHFSLLPQKTKKKSTLSRPIISSYISSFGAPWSDLKNPKSCDSHRAMDPNFEHPRVASQLAARFAFWGSDKFASQG